MKKENLGAYCASNDLSLPKKTDKCIKINWQKDMNKTNGNSKCIPPMKETEITRQRL